MRKALLIVLVLTGCLNVYAQNTGYLGKHVILKTDLLNGRKNGFQNIDLEVALSRTLSLTASYYRFSYAGLTNKKEVLQDRTVNLNIYDNQFNYMASVQFYDYRIVYPGRTTGLLYSIGAKYYLNKILPAPSGAYTNFDLGFGSAQLDHEYQKTLRPVTKKSVGEITEGRQKIHGSASFISVSFPSAGYQAILFKRVTIDGRLSLETNINNLPNSLLNEYPYTYLSSNIASLGFKNISTGLSMYVKAGVLIF